MQHEMAEWTAINVCLEKLMTSCCPCAGHVQPEPSAVGGKASSKTRLSLHSSLTTQSYQACLLLYRLPQPHRPLPRPLQQHLLRQQHQQLLLLPHLLHLLQCMHLPQRRPCLPPPQLRPPPPPSQAPPLPLLLHTCHSLHLHRFCPLLCCC